MTHTKALYLQTRGAHGLLLSGGSDRHGRLPWAKYVDAIREIAETSGLFLSAHVGFPDLETCRQLKKSGLRQALLDVMGDEETASRVYHLTGLQPVRDALDSLSQSGLQLSPSHCGRAALRQNERRRGRAADAKPATISRFSSSWCSQV